MKTLVIQKWLIKADMSEPSVLLLHTYCKMSESEAHFPQKLILQSSSCEVSVLPACGLFISNILSYLTWIFILISNF